MKTLNYFTSPTCGPCKMFRPIVDMITSETSVPTNYIDVSVSMDIANKFDIRAVPTVILMEDGRPIKRHTGIMSKDQFKQFITNS